MVVDPEVHSDENEKRASKAREAFKFAGGVPRLCCAREVSKVKDIVDASIGEYSIQQMVQQLYALDESITEAGVGIKIHPGLVGHIFPVNKFRNTFRIQPPSPYVTRELARKEENSKESSVHKLMRDLLSTPKAQGFAGWIWEPLLTKKMRGDLAGTTIVGSVLPAGADGATTMVLLHESASATDFTEFNTMEEFLRQAREYVKEGSFIIAALQLTVAQECHSVLQSRPIEFVCACREIGKEKPELQPQPQLWFLQPYQCLSSFRFVKLQALEFDELTFPATEAIKTNPTESNSVRKSACKRNRVNFLGDWAPSAQPNGRLSSNNRAYWDEAVRTSDQFVGIVQIREDTSKSCEDDPIVSEFKQRLKDIADVPNDHTSGTVEPGLRDWSATTDIMNRLSSCIHDSLVSAIQRDIACDKQSLEDAGFVFPNTVASAPADGGTAV